MFIHRTVKYISSILKNDATQPREWNTTIAQVKGEIGKMHNLKVEHRVSHTKKKLPELNACTHSKSDQ